MAERQRLTVFEVQYLDTRWFFSSRDLAQVFISTLARAMGLGAHTFVLLEHEVDAP